PPPDSFPSAWSEDLAEHLSADVLRARLVVGHHPARGGQDRNAEAVANRRQILDLRIDAAARLRHARDVPDHRLAVEVLELDADLADARLLLLLRVATDVALALKHVQNVRPQLRA